MECKILIVEDDVFIAGAMAEIVEETLGAIPILASSCGEALAKIDSCTVFALLDVDVTDGPTYDVARQLKHMGIPFVFISGNPPAKLPEDLRDCPYLSKPALPSEIIYFAKTLTANSQSHYVHSNTQCV
jgi:CheY-like chemotaxis protein